MKIKILAVLCLVFLCAVSVFAKEILESQDWTQIEWRNGDKDLPRVLMIGDSIVNGYHFKLREKLEGVFYVDKIVTSRCLDHEIYWKQIDMMLCEKKYDMIFFNFGLHGFYMNDKDYAKGIDRLAKTLLKETPKIAYLATTPLREDNEGIKDLNLKVIRRNIIAKKMTEKYGIDYIDQYNLVLGKEGIRIEDPYHYNEAGKELQADFISKIILEMYKGK